MPANCPSPEISTSKSMENLENLKVYLWTTSPHPRVPNTIFHIQQCFTRHIYVLPICIVSIGQPQTSANIYIGKHLWTKTSVTICIRKHLWTKTSVSIGIGTYIWPICLTRGNPPIQGLWLLSALEPGNFLSESWNFHHSYLMHRHSFRISIGEP